MPSKELSKEILLSTLHHHREEIKSFGVKELSLFGSFANGNARKDSDIDLLVEFDTSEKTYDNFIELSFYLENLFGREVELITRQSLSRYIGPHILEKLEHVHI